MPLRVTATDTWLGREEKSGTGSDAFILNDPLCRWLLESGSGYWRHATRFLLQRGFVQDQPSDETLAYWRFETDMVITTGVTGLETSLDHFLLGQARLPIPWSEHLDWLSDFIHTSVPVEQLFLRTVETLQNPPGLPAESGRFQESVWIEESFETITEKYAGLWIAVEGTSVISIAQTELDVLKQAARVGHDAPYTYRVPSEDEPAPMAATD